MLNAIVNKNWFLLFTILVFLYVFNFTISAVIVSSTVIVAFIFFLALFKNRKIRRSVVASMLNDRVLISALLFTGIYGAFLSQIWGAGEFVFFGIFVKFAVTLIVALAFGFYIYNFQSGKSDSDVGQGFSILLELYFFAALLQSIFVIATFVWPEFRDFLSASLVNRGNIDVDSLLRYRGLHDSGGFDLTAELGVGAIYSLFSAFSSKKKIKIFRIFCTAIFIFAIALSGRSGFVIFGIGSIFFLIRWPRKFLIAIICFVAFVMVMIFLIRIFFPEQYKVFDSQIFNYAFEFIVNYSGNEGFRTDSTDDLKEMLFIPDWINIFFGSGSFDNVYEGVPRSDSGYLKTILAGGAIGFFLVYGVCLTLLARIAYRLRFKRDMLFFFLVFAVIMFVLEIKAPVFYQNGLFRLLLLMYGVALAYQYSSSKLMLDQHHP